jgi:P-type Cu+ transporter
VHVYDYLEFSTVSLFSFLFCVFHAQMSTRKVFLSVCGMTCSVCSTTVENFLTSREGVLSAKVSLLTERAEVVYDSAVVTSEDLVSEIDDVGFEASLAASDTHTGKVRIVLHENETFSSADVEQCLLRQQGVHSVHFLPQDKGPSASARSQSSRSDGTDGTTPTTIELELQLDSKQASLRTILKSLKENGFTTAHVRIDGDLESRKSEMQEKRDKELQKWRRAFWQSMLFTVPAAFFAIVAPLIPDFDVFLLQSVFFGLPLKFLLLWLLVTPVQFHTGACFYVGAYKSLKYGSASMDVLVGLYYKTPRSFVVG